MIERDGATIRIYAPKRKSLYAFGISSTLTLAMFVFNQMGLTEGKELDWLFVYVLAFGSVMALSFVIFKKTILEINPSGLKVFRGLLMPLRVVPWAHIHYIGPVGNGSAFIGVELKREFAGVTSRVMGSMTGYEVLIPSVDLPDGEKMLDLLTARWQHAVSVHEDRA